MVYEAYEHIELRTTDSQLLGECIYEELSFNSVMIISRCDIIHKWIFGETIDKMHYITVSPIHFFSNRKDINKQQTIN